MAAKTKVNYPIFGKEEEKLVLKVLRSGKWWRGGTLKEMQASVTGRFEKEYSKFTGAKHCLAVSNGTAAPELALKAAGLGAGDEVLVPALSFVVTGTVPLLVNAVPVFVDIDPETYQMDPKDIERKITKKTRAILLVHYGGYPADMDRIIPLAKKHKLIVIEDCAHAQGTQWRGKHAGTFGAAGTFSFQMSKAITSGEGGAIITNNKEMFYKCYSYHHIGRLEQKGFYDFFYPAWNYRLTEFQGALLLCQLRRYKKMVKEKHAAGVYLAAELSKIGGVEPLKRDKRITRRGYYYFVIRYDAKHFNNLPRADFLAALAKEGVILGRGYGKPIYKEPLFQQGNFGNNSCPVKCSNYGKVMDYKKVCCPNAERACAEEQVTLHHIQLGLGRKHLDKIIKAIIKVKAASWKD